MVFGAAGGLGRGVAECLAADGMGLALIDLDESQLENLEKDLGGRGVDVITAKADVTRPEELDQIREMILDRFEKVHLVFNTIAVTTTGRFWDLTPQDWEWVVSVNFWGAFNVTRTFLPHLREAGSGHLIHTSSTTAVAPGRGNSSSYLASKHALVALCEAVQQDLRAVGSRVQVSVALPGTVRSDIATSERNRQAQFGPPTMKEEDIRELHQYLQDQGVDGTQLASNLLRELDEGKFYLFGREKDRQVVGARYESILSGLLPPE